MDPVPTSLPAQTHHFEQKLFVEMNNGEERAV
jgi:hypothetical protein